MEEEELGRTVLGDDIQPKGAERQEDFQATAIEGYCMRLQRQLSL